MTGEVVYVSVMHVLQSKPVRDRGCTGHALKDISQHLVEIDV